MEPEIYVELVGTEHPESCFKMFKDMTVREIMACERVDVYSIKFMNAEIIAHTLVKNGEPVDTRMDAAI